MFSQFLFRSSLLLFALLTMAFSSPVPQASAAASTPAESSKSKDAGSSDKQQASPAGPQAPAPFSPPPYPYLYPSMGPFQHPFGAALQTMSPYDWLYSRPLAGFGHPFSFPPMPHPYGGGASFMPSYGATLYPYSYGAPYSHSYAASYPHSYGSWSSGHQRTPRMEMDRRIQMQKEILMYQYMQLDHALLNEHNPDLRKIYQNQQTSIVEMLNRIILGQGAATDSKISVVTIPEEVFAKWAGISSANPTPLTDAASLGLNYGYSPHHLRPFYPSYPQTYTYAPYLFGGAHYNSPYGYSPSSFSDPFYLYKKR